MSLYVSAVYDNTTEGFKDSNKHPSELDSGFEVSMATDTSINPSSQAPTGNPIGLSMLVELMKDLQKDNKNLQNKIDQDNKNLLNKIDQTK